MERDTYKYNFRKERKIVHTGITGDPERRERELRNQYSGGKISQVSHKVTYESALEWERRQRQAGKPTGP